MARIRSQKYKEYMRQYAKDHPDKYRWYAKGVRRKLRDLVLEKLGNKCGCCGESRREFLAVDHVNGDGHHHRQLSDRIKVLRDIRDEGFPRDKYQVLCHNCNMAKAFYGICPHTVN